jgi:hypothetical protein
MAETRKIAAILVADIVGYNRLAGADEIRILARFGGGGRVERQGDLSGAGHQRQQCRSHASATGRGGVRGDAEAQIQPQLRPAADFRRRGGGETDRFDLLAGSGGVRPLQPASPRRESRRIEHRREGQQNAIGRTLKKCAQTAPQSAMGDPARRQRGLCSRHGRRSGNLPEAARSRSSSRVCRRDLQAIDRRDARADPVKAGSAQKSGTRVRVPAHSARRPGSPRSPRAWSFEVEARPYKEKW